MPDQLTVLDVKRNLSGWFKGDSWAAWDVALAALFGLDMTPEQVDIFRRHTGRDTPPTQPVREGWFVCGRRGGKSYVAALVAIWAGVFRPYAGLLSPGERGIVMVAATDRAQARVIFGYVTAFFQHVPALAKLVERRTREALHLSNGISIEIHTCSFRSIRGRTVVAFIADELAFWRDETSANPDVEVLNAVRPSMATVPGAVMLMLSTPHARRGALWTACRDHYGKDGDPILVWRASSKAMNPLLDDAVIAQAFEQDPLVAASEFGIGESIEFRTDVETFIGREVLEAVTAPGRLELPPVAGTPYVAFTDPAGGSGGDSFTLAIAHPEQRGDRVVAVLDCLRERRPPFSPEGTVEEFAATCAAYGIGALSGDRYAGSWPAEQFAKRGMVYLIAERPKSDLYRDALPLFTSGRVELLDHQHLAVQMLTLERRTGRSGRDVIDHAPNAHDDLANAACGALLLALEAGMAVVDTGPTPEELASLRRALPGWRIMADHGGGIYDAGEAAVYDEDLGLRMDDERYPPW